MKSFKFALLMVGAILGQSAFADAVVYGTKAHPLRVYVGKTPRTIALAKLLNHSKVPSRWNLQTRDKGIRFVPSGETAGGRSSTLTAVIPPIADGLGPAQLLLVTLGYEKITAEIFVLVTPLRWAGPQNCQVEVSLDRVTVVQGQGFSEGALELQVQATADTDHTTWPSPGNFAQLRQNETAPVLSPIRVFTIARGSTLTIDIAADALEDDGFAFGGTYAGNARGVMQLECGRQDTKTLQVAVPSHQGGGIDTGLVDVVFAARTIQ